tara:strand:+ start:462 stop:650 length:189 start_codon:yes stop_codon:yes gene_type:complete
MTRHIPYFLLILFLASCGGGGSSSNSNSIPKPPDLEEPPVPEVLEVKTLPDEVVLFSTGAST